MLGKAVQDAPKAADEEGVVSIPAQTKPNPMQKSEEESVGGGGRGVCGAGNGRGRLNAELGTDGTKAAWAGVRHGMRLAGAGAGCYLSGLVVPLLLFSHWLLSVRSGPVDRCLRPCSSSHPTPVTRSTQRLTHANPRNAQSQRASLAERVDEAIRKMEGAQRRAGASALNMEAVRQELTALAKRQAQEARAAADRCVQGWWRRGCRLALCRAQGKGGLVVGGGWGYCKDVWKRG